MTRSIKFLALLIITGLLSACGFTPLHGTSNNTQYRSATVELSQIDIGLIPDREGQFLRNALLDKFYTNGTPTNPRYRLKITPIKENVFDFDITIDSEATRKQIRLNTTMALSDAQSGKELFSRNLIAITSHNVLESEFSTIVTEQSAREAALNDLARQVERQLALYFKK